jgi:predicted HAD superfamily Cof-like phosphohydrolase
VDSQDCGGLDLGYERVRDFHEAFGHPTGGLPRPLPYQRAITRGKWMREEVDEFEQATDLVSQADAMLDLMYFALGTLVEMGVRPERLFDIVHQANMSKRPANGAMVFAADGKIEKPDGWVPPETRLRQALVADYTGYDFVPAGKVGATAAVLAMVAHALGVSGLAAADFQHALDGTGDPVDLARFGLVDDYVADVGDAEGLLRESLESYRCVAVAGDMSGLVLVSTVDGDGALLVDPDPDTGGLRYASLDDVLAAVRERGVHRFRRLDAD